MKKYLFVFIFILGFCSKAYSKDIIVLMPGTYNSLSFGGFSLQKIYSPYFSTDVIKTVREKGYEIFIPRWLAPFGSFESNGTKAFYQFEKWIQRKSIKPNEIKIIGHSAGGFYALHFASLAKKYPITSVTMVSTPFRGSKLAQLVTNGVAEIGFQGIFQLKEDMVKKFLEKVTINQKLKLFAVSMKKEEFKFSLSNLFSLPLKIAAKILGEPSDGVVSVRSTLPENIIVNNLGIQRIEFNEELDHIEQFLDHRFFSIFNKKVGKEIKKKQRLLYQTILTHF